MHFDQDQVAPWLKVNFKTIVAQRWFQKMVAALKGRLQWFSISWIGASPPHQWSLSSRTAGSVLAPCGGTCRTAHQQIFIGSTLHGTISGLQKVSAQWSLVVGPWRRRTRRRQQRPASWTTFWRAYQRWHDVLRPRAKTDHAQCQTCFELQSEMYAKHNTPQQKLELAHAWRVHLQNQYLDRQIYWSLRHAARQPGSEVLTIIIESMDKKKKLCGPNGGLMRSPRQEVLNCQSTWCYKLTTQWRKPRMAS